jgi:hypothetical protein
MDMAADNTKRTKVLPLSSLTRAGHAPTENDVEPLLRFDRAEVIEFCR